MRKIGEGMVSTRQAAEELGMSLLTLYYKMQHGLINIGHAWKQEGSNRWNHDIYRKLLDAEKERLGLGHDVKGD